MSEVIETPVPSILESAQQSAALSHVAQALAPQVHANIVDADFLYDTRREVQDIGIGQPLLDAAVRFARAETVNYFALGGVLARIKEEKPYRNVEPCYPTFGQYVEAQLGIGQAVARQYADVYRRLENVPITEEQARRLGWSKLRLIASTMTAANVARQVEKFKSMSLAQIALDPEVQGSKNPKKASAGKAGAAVKHASKHAPKASTTTAPATAGAASAKPASKPIAPATAAPEVVAAEYIKGLPIEALVSFLKANRDDAKTLGGALVNSFLSKSKSTPTTKAKTPEPETATV